MGKAIDLSTGSEVRTEHGSVIAVMRVVGIADVCMAGLNVLWLV